jgi:hypothetical protein
MVHTLLSSTDPQDLKEKKRQYKMRSKAGNRRGCNQTKLQQAILPDVTEYKIFMFVHLCI